jgi:tetratricopeptide (TPR) repeat protein
MRHDDAGMQREVAFLAGKAGIEDLVIELASETAAHRGQFSRARRLSARAAESAERLDEQETAAGYYTQGAIREALVGNSDLAIRHAHKALAISHGKEIEGVAAIALGLAGQSAQANILAEDLVKRFPQDTTVKVFYLPMIDTAVALYAGESDRAINALTVSAPYELGAPTIGVSFALYPVYLLGAAYLMAQKGGAAAVEFQKILDHPGLVLNEPIGALAHLELGRAYTMSGERVQAKGDYEEFFALWKDADPDIPIMKQAKAEYAKLQ